MRVPPPPPVPLACPVSFTAYQLEDHKPWDDMLPIDTVSFARIATELKHGVCGLAARAMELRRIIAAGKAAAMAVTAWQTALAAKRQKANRLHKAAAAPAMMVARVADVAAVAHGAVAAQDSRTIFRWQEAAVVDVV